MSVKRQISYNYGIFFITFICHQWLSLIEIINGYDVVYKWFDYLKSQGYYIVGYVVMPNHIHTLIGFKNTEKSINTIVGNGKRFMAYEISARLKQQNNISILAALAAAVNESDFTWAISKEYIVLPISWKWKI